MDKTGLIGMILLVELVSRSNISLLRIAVGVSMLMMDIGMSMDDAIDESNSWNGCFTSFLIKYQNIRLIRMGRYSLYHGSRRYLPVGLWTG